jgi:hypothetical protein
MAFAAGNRVSGRYATRLGMLRLLKLGLRIALAGTASARR